MVSVRVPAEPVLETRRDMKPELVENFIADISGIHTLSNNPRADVFTSNGSDEREIADAWLERVHSMNAVELHVLVSG